MTKALLNCTYAPGGNLPSGVTYYAPTGQSSSGFLAGTEANVKTSLLATGTLSKLCVYCASNSISASSTVRIRKNGANGNQSVSIGSGSTGSFIDSSNTDSITSGDDVDTSIATGSGGSGAQFQSISVIYDDADSATTWFSSFLSTNTASVDRYFPLVSGIVNVAAFEANVQYKAKSAGTLTGLSCYIMANGRTSTTTVRTRVNGANGNCSVSIGSSSTGIFEDTSSTDSISVNDLINFGSTTGSSTSFIRSECCSITFYGTGDDTMMINGQGDSTGKVMNASSTHYMPLGGDIGTNSSESPAYSLTNFAAQASKMNVYIRANTVSAASTLNYRVNGANTSLTVSITASTTGWFEDTTHTADITSTDTVNYQFVIGGSGTSLAVQTVGSLIKKNGTAYTSTLGEVVTIVSTLSKIESRSLSEVVTIVSTLMKTPSRSLQEIVTLVESFLSTTGKGFTETVTLDDTFSRVISKIYSEAIIVSDLFERIIEKTLSETVVLVDTCMAAFTLILNEAIELADACAKGFSRAFSEAFALVDSFVNGVNKALNEVISLEESFVKAVSKGFSEALTIVEVFTKSKLIRGLIRGIAKRTNTIFGTASNKSVQRGKSTSTNTRRGSNL